MSSDVKNVLDCAVKMLVCTIIHFNILLYALDRYLEIKSRLASIYLGSLKIKNLDVYSCVILMCFLVLIGIYAQN